MIFPISLRLHISSIYFITFQFPFLVQNINYIYIDIASLRKSINNSQLARSSLVPSRSPPCQLSQRLNILINIRSRERTIWKGKKKLFVLAALKEALSFSLSLSFSRKRRVLFPKRKRKWFWGRARAKRNGFHQTEHRFCGNRVRRHTKNPPHPSLPMFRNVQLQNIVRSEWMHMAMRPPCESTMHQESGTFFAFFVGRGWGWRGKRDSGTRVKHMHPRSGGLYPPVVSMVCAFQPPNLSISLIRSFGLALYLFPNLPAPGLLGMVVLLLGHP